MPQRCIVNKKIRMQNITFAKDKNDIREMSLPATPLDLSLPPALGCKRHEDRPRLFLLITTSLARGPVPGTS